MRQAEAAADTGREIVVVDREHVDTIVVAGRSGWSFGLVVRITISFGGVHGRFV